MRYLERTQGREWLWKPEKELRSMSSENDAPVSRFIHALEVQTEINLLDYIKIKNEGGSEYLGNDEIAAMKM